MPRPFIGAIIQARLTSTRLPRKHLLQVAGIPLLEHLINRVRQCSLIDKIIIASPHNPECCLNEEIFIGSENDVLDRYYQAAKKYQLDAVVRLTADCPFVPTSEIYRVVSRYLDGGCEYVTNVSRGSGRFGTPDGWDVEIFSMATLEEANAYAKGDEREHVTPYMKKNCYPVFLEPLKLSVDTLEDFESVRKFYEGECLNYPKQTETLWSGQGKAF